MARKRKLPTSPSCQGEGICSESGIDRFSVLPDEVAHHILSFLNFKDLTRVGALSKRCRRFHLSVPVVDFGSDWRPRTKTNQFRARLMSSFDRYLLDRGHNRLRRFHVSWKFSAAERVKKLCDDDYRVHTWIQSAVRCKVEELHMCNLTVHCANLNDDLVPGMVSLLRGMPSLTTLYIKKTRPSWLRRQITSTGFGMEYWKLQNLAFILQLEEVTIENSHGSNDIEFARYVLENAQNLKKMVIVLRDKDEQEKVVVGMVSTSKKGSTATVLIRVEMKLRIHILSPCNFTQT
ncbi:hypothetical protein ACFX13_033593 [Malus domestica]